MIFKIPEFMKILLLEDNTADAELTIRTLKKTWTGCTVKHIVTIREAKEILAGKPEFDIALLDMQLPDGSGMDVLMEIREKKLDMAVAMLTGSGDEEVAVAALKAGADDYTVKQPGYTVKVPLSVELAIENHRRYNERASGAIHVLYIEHNAADVDFTHRHLTRYAPYIRLTNVSNAEKALELLPEAGVSPEEWNYQLILMDYRLPGMNALEIIKEIRQERQLDIPILIVTGHGNEEVAVQALKVGASDYLVKRENYLTRLPSLMIGAYQNCELKRKQKALADSESKYRLLAENSGDVIFTLDFDLNFTYVSPAVFKLRGFSIEEVLQQNITETLTPASLDKVNQLLDRMLPEAVSGNQYPEPVVVELQTYKKDNSLIWVEVTATLLTNDEGKPIGILGVTRDISKRKAVQSELRKLSRAVTQSPDSIFITDKNGNIEYANPKFTQLTGYSLDEVLGKNPRILNSGEQSKSYYKQLWDTILAGKDWSGEFRNRKKNGELYWESAGISPLVDSDGKITHFVAVKEDITEKKKTEELLKHHSELQQILLKIASRYINVRPVNFEESLLESLKEMGGFAKADRAYIFEYDWKYQTITNTVEWCAENITPQKDVLQQIPLVNFSFWVEKHRKGEEIFISDFHSVSGQSDLYKLLEEKQVKSVGTFPMMEENECVGFIGFDWVKNYHTYSESEQILLRVFTQMLVNVKTRVSLEKNLIIEKDRAEAADRLKTAFLNNISHEVRTPLNGILGFGRFLIQPDLTQIEKEQYLKILQKSSYRLINTITSFMDISLITSGNMPALKKMFPLQPWLNEVIELIEPHIREKGLKLQITPDPGSLKGVEIESDAELLKKVFFHLTDNAVKFTKEGTVTFGCRVENGILYGTVEDTGVGIETCKQKTVFERFTQADSSNTRGYEGSGLGLSIAKGLVELLGGEISLESEKGRRTRVDFSVPVSNAIKKAKKYRLTGATVKNDAVVLIAEDDAMNRFFVEVILEKAGIQSVWAENGLDAVALCKSNSNIGLVLMDLKMPVLDGLEATRQIKSFKPGLPVIATTAQAMKGDEKLALDAGCDEYLSKPFKHEVLVQKVRRYLGNFKKM